MPAQDTTLEKPDAGKAVDTAINQQDVKLDGGAPIPPEVKTAPEVKTPETKTPEIKQPEVKQPETKVEGDEDKTSLDDFLDAKNVNRVPDKATPKVEPKPDDKALDKLDDKTVVKSTDTKPDNFRDLTGIAEEDKQHFLRMSTAAFNRLKPVYLEKAKVEEELGKTKEQLSKAGQMPDSYYEHPAAFILDQEFQENTSNVKVASDIANHWQRQLALIDSGKDWQDLDIKDGKYVLSEAKVADNNARAQVIRNMNFADRQVSEFQTKANAIQHTFANKHRALATELKQAEDTWFPSFKDDKHPLQPVVKDMLAKLPPALRNHPMATLLAKSLTVNAELGRRMAKLSEAKPTDTTDKTQRQPNLNDMGGGGDKKNGDDAEVTMDDFNARKMTYK